MAHIVIDRIAQPFHGACYSKLTSREREIVEFLIGIDVLEVMGNKIVVRGK